jgi:O-antigen/teichoic acid export membrane protein
LSFFLFLNNLRDYITSFFQAIQKMEKQFIVNFVESLLTLIFGIIFLLTLRNFVSFAFAYFFGIFFSFILALLLAKNFLIYLKPKINYEFIKYYLINGLPLALFGMLGFVFFTTDQIILGKVKRSRDSWLLFNCHKNYFNFNNFSIFIFSFTFSSVGFKCR